MKKLFIVLTILIFASCNENENPTYKLTGRWKWAYICGGFTGACGYADENTTRILEITKNKMTETFNDQSVTITAYSVLSKTNYKGYTEYQIQFDNESVCRIKTTKKTLEIEEGDIWIGYKK